MIYNPCVLPKRQSRGMPVVIAERTDEECILAKEDKK